MFLAAWWSRGSSVPRSGQECQRIESPFWTSTPQPERLWLWVTWKGVSGSHTVTSDVGAPLTFDQPISQDGNGTLIFTAAGAYHYHCSIHPSMRGAIVVSAPNSTHGAGT
jgi:hypothetical protein